MQAHSAPHIARRTLLPVVVLCLGFGTGLALAGDRGVANRDPAEDALALFAQPITRRVVVRGDDQALDVWLISKVPFHKTGARLRRAAQVQLALPGGLKIIRATWLDPDQTWWVDIAGGGRSLRMTVSRHRQGSRFVLRGIGRERDVGPWAPPYRPTPINLPHGPLRP